MYSQQNERLRAVCCMQFQTIRGSATAQCTCCRICCKVLYMYASCVLSLLLVFILLFQRRDAYECVVRHKFSTLMYRLCYLNGLAMHIIQFNSDVYVYMFYQRESIEKCYAKPEISVLVCVCSTILYN